MKQRKRFTALLATVASVFYGCSAQDDSLANFFVPVDLKMTNYDLMDLGVVDVNSDLQLDIYTVNHSAAQSLLIASGNGEYQNVFDNYGLGQTRNYPGVEDSAAQPVMDKPGWYIYRQNKRLHLVANNTEALGVLTGTLQAPWPLEILAGQATLSMSALSSAVEPPTASTTLVEFSLHDGDHLTIAGKDNIVEVPHSFIVGEKASLNNIYLGKQLQLPQSANFTLLWRDRHSMAWTDINADGLLDVYIGRGGIKGQIQNLSTAINDELFVQGAEGFLDYTEAYRFRKSTCPGRRSEWVDADDDSDLDLYLSCGRGSINGFPDTLYTNIDGELTEDSSRGFGYTAESVVTWVDIDGDGDSDLLSVEGKELALYRNKQGVFTRDVLTSQVAPRVRKFVVADFDNDGDFDIYLVGRIESLLLLAEPEGFDSIPPATVGLPANAETANWVDFDNDGLLDMHAIPGGLYQQQVDGTFKNRGQIHRELGKPRVSSARCSWFDFNSDGKRDALCAVQRYAIAPLRWLYKLLSMEHKVYFWETVLVRNESETGNWLAVKLNGPEGNPQAIGASATLDMSSAQQIQHVGQNDGAHFSQGHYRLYYGLGDNDRAHELVITWPGGERQQLLNLAVNQILEVNSPQVPQR